LMSETIAQIRIFLIRTLPWLDCVDATVEMASNPSLRNARRLINSYKRVAEQCRRK